MDQTNYDIQFQRNYNFLNFQQKEAVETLDGPALLIAGPGSGKTQVLTLRAANLIRHGIADPENILIITFTRAGTEAIRKRLYQMIGPEAAEFNIHTFHDLCHQIVSMNLNYFGFHELNPITSFDEKKILYDIIDTVPKESALYRGKGDRYFEANRLRDIFSVIIKEYGDEKLLKIEVLTELDKLKYLAKSLGVVFPEEQIEAFPEFFYQRKYKQFQKGMVKPGVVNKRIQDLKKTRDAIELFQIYIKELETRGVYTFDQMIEKVITAMNSSVEYFLRPLQEKYQFIMMDESQDTNGVQFDFVYKLMDYHQFPDIFVIGDPRQCIYGFQGARTRRIAQFIDMYKPKIIDLNKNYRSTQEIIDAAVRVIDKNPKLEGQDNKLIAGRTIPGETMVQAWSFDNDFSEQVGIVRHIQSLIEGGEKPENIAVLCRKADMAKPIIKMLLNSGIDVATSRKTNIFESDIVTHLLILFEAITDIGNTNEVYKALMLPYKKSRNTSASYNLLMEFKKELREKTWNQTFTDYVVKHGTGNLKENASAILRLHKQSQTFSALQLLELIINEYSLLNFADKHENRLFTYEVLKTLYNFFKQETLDKQTSLKSKLNLTKMMMKEKITLNIENFIQSSAGKVTGSTCHGSKGLEWNHVIIPGCITTNWEKIKGPSQSYKMPLTIQSSDSSNKEEEERRLFFVAMTRAERTLTMTYSETKENGSTNSISKFLMETEIEVEKKEVEPSILADIGGRMMIPKIKEDILIPSEKIDEIISMMILSYSSISTYKKSPAAFYFEKVLKLPFKANASSALGNCVHKALEVYYKQLRLKREDRVHNWRSPVLLSETFEKQAEIESMTLIDEEYNLFIKRKDEHHRLLIDYWNEYLKGVEYNKCYAEYNLAGKGVKIKGIPLKVIIDRVDILDRDNIKVNVIDYKTGKTENIKKECRGHGEKMGRYKYQQVFTNICIHLMDHEAWQVQENEIVIFDEEKGISTLKVEILPEDIEYVEQDVLTVAKAIGEHDFWSKENNDCPWWKFYKTL